MRKIGVVAWNCLLRLYRDPRALLLLLMMPMLLIGILGFSLDGVMDEGRINPFTVLVVNEDTAARPPRPPGAPPEAAADLPAIDYGRILVEEVLQSDEVSRVLIVQEETDLPAAQEAVKAGEAAAAIHVPPGFSQAALDGEPLDLEVFTDPGQSFAADIVLQVALAFADQIELGVPTNTAGLRPQLVEVPSGNKPVTAMQYYAAAMAIMFMVFTALSRSREIIEERQGGTLARLLTTPTGMGTVLAGQVLGSMVVLMAQFLILALGTRLLFGVDWGPPLPALTLGVAFALAASGMSVLATVLFRDPRTADVAGALIGQLLAALSGGMFPLYLFPDFMKGVARLTPNYWALQGFLDQMSGAGLSYLWLPVVVLTGLGVVTGAAGIWRLRAEEGG